MTLAKYFRYQLKRTMLMLPLVFFTFARIWAQSASTTTMSASATTATWPADITLTATVTSGGSPVSPGLVKFCNASAASCQGPALLAQAQLTSSGKASATLALGIGSHSIKALFVGTHAVASSTSSAQTVTLTGLPGSMTTLTSSATSPYTLTATVAGAARSALSGNVTFNDASNNGFTLGTAALGTATTQLSFGIYPYTGTGAYPLAMTVGDFNGDGYPDIVLGNSSADANGNYTLTVFLSTGPSSYSSYGPPTTVTLPTSPVDFQNAAAFAVGDFNNDGNLDLAIAGDNSNEVLILLGNGAGSFTPAGIASTGFTPNSIVVGDFNGDGNADVAVTNRGSSTVSVFLGDGTGNLNPVSASPATGSFPYWLAVGDFNGDGKQDLAVANYFGFNVTVLLGNGDGTFTQAASSPATGVYPAALTVADFNGDGNQDLAVVNQYSKTVTILLGDGKGDFTPTSTSPATGNNPNSIATADFNGDGIPDLAVANGSDNTISIFLGKGDGTFPASRLVNLAAGTGPGSISVGDWGGDGFEDVAVAGAANNSAIVALNTTTTTATASVSGITVPGGGTHNITASFVGNSNYQPSKSFPVPLAGTIIPTSLSLTVAPKGTVGVGETIQLTATITPAAISGLAPTGSVTFYNGSTVIAEVLGTGNVEIENYPLTAAGTLKLSAKYSGDGNFTASTSGTVSATVISPTPSATALTISSASVAKETPVTLTATVTSGGNPVPYGAVQFTKCPPVNFACELGPSAILGTVQLTTKGTATLKQALPVGSYTFFATFLGTNDVQRSASGTQALTVTGTLSSNTFLSRAGQPGNYTLNASVQGSWPPPMGNVSFVDTSNNNLVVAMGAVSPTSSAFGLVQPIAAGEETDWVAVGDFNGDGKPDLAVTNFKSNSVSVLLNNGSGNFTIDAAAIPSSVKFDGPIALVTGDFNGDGNLDLAVLNGTNSVGPGTVTILLGIGNGSFTLKATYPTMILSFDLVAADFNGDGKLDLAVTNAGSGTLTILLGNGDGTFTADAESPVVPFPVGIVSADFNGDGKADLAVANFGPGTVTVLLGNGDGTFNVTTPISIGSDTNPEYLAVADFNLDNKPDLAVSNDESDTVSILLNQGGGNFVLSQTVPVGGSTPNDIVTADFNGDGIPDVAVANQSGIYTILYSEGIGVFLPQSFGLSSGMPYGLAVGDFDGDGGPDLVVADLSNGVTPLLNQAVSSLSLPSISIPGAGTHELIASYSAIAPYTNSASGTVPFVASPIATTVAITPSPGWIVPPNSTVTLNVAVSPTSIDNYTLSGTVVLDNGETLIGQKTLTNGMASFSTTLTTAGATTFTATYSGSTQFAASSSQLVMHVVPASTITLSVSATSVASGTPANLTADVTSGGKPVTQGVITFCNATSTLCENSAVLGTANLTSSGSASLKLALGIGAHSIKAVFAPTLSEAGATSNIETITVTAKNPTATTLTDSVVSGTYTLTAKVMANGAHPAGGTVSFVDSTSNTTLSTASLVAGFSSLSFAGGTSPAVGANPQYVVTGDFNRDGKQDLAVANATSGTVSILLSNGDGTFTTKSTPVVGSDPPAMAVGDFNGDGIPDLAVANFASSTVTILLGNGDGTFTTKSSPSAGSAPIAIAAGDFNADGRLDLAVVNDGSANLTILLGNGDGTFTTGVTPAVGFAPHGIAIADFNSDGKLDLAVTNYDSGTVSILLGNGDGTFTSTALLAADSDPWAIAAGDFNGDGKPDLAVANYGDGTLSIFLNSGNGTFATPKTVPVSAKNQLSSVTAADFNQDGKLDLAVTVLNKAQAFVLLGNGNGTFTQQSPISTGTQPYSIAAGDFIGDGLPGLAVANDGSNNVDVVLNNLKTSATATLSGVTVTGSGNQSVVAKYPGATNFSSSTSNTLSIPTN